VRIVFLGSGAFAIPSLEALLDAGHEVAAVVSQPDRQKGRGLQTAPPPVKAVALRRGLTVLQPRRVREPAAQDELRALRPELQVVAAYGQILPQSVIDIAPRGTVNVHASLLPRYRGAAPVQWAIARGERETGVTTMLIDAGLDTGAILLARSTPIGADETAPELEARLARMGAELLLETIAGLEAGRVVPVPQDHARATLAPLLKKEDGQVDWSWPAEAIAARVRAFQPWPGTVARLGGRALKLWKARPEAAAAGEAAPGTVVHSGREGIVVACGGGTTLRLLQLQPENGRVMDAAAFAAGARLAAGARFD
jgi:methionyl-tRNA formyltransferase